MSLIPYYRDIFQLGYVARDLEAAMDFLAEKTGAGDFVCNDHELTVRTRDGEHPFAIRVAIATSGTKQIEVIQPVSGAVDHYLDGIDYEKSIITFHHVGLAVRGPIAAWTQMEDAVRASGDDFTVSFAADAGEDAVVRFAYVDTRPWYGHYTEYLWWNPAFMAGNPAFPNLDA